MLKLLEMNIAVGIFKKPVQMMKFLRFTPFLLLFCMQYSAKAQIGQEYQEIKKSADSLAKIEEFPKAEALYLKALKVCNQNPFLRINLASLYLKMQNTDEAKKFMESAVVLGADMDMLLQDVHINNYLSINQEQYARYSFLGNRQNALIQLEDRSTWIDDFRKRF